MVRNPTLAELSLDLSFEVERFRYHLNSMTRCDYAIAVGGSPTRPHGTTSGDIQTAREFTSWVHDRLSDPRIAFRSPLRQALILAAAHTCEFESLDFRDRPGDECFYVLLGKHELISNAARRGLASGCCSLAEWWNKFDDCVAMLEIMALLVYPDEQMKHSLRCFAARCKQLDSDMAELVFRFEQPSPRSYASYFEPILAPTTAPVINLSDRSMGWDEMLSITQQLCRQVLSRRKASKAQLANTMRRWIENPWL